MPRVLSTPASLGIICGDVFGEGVQIRPRNLVCNFEIWFDGIDTSQVCRFTDGSSARACVSLSCKSQLMSPLVLQVIDERIPAFSILDPLSIDFTLRHRRCKFTFPFQRYVPFTLLNPDLLSSSSPLTLSSFSGSAVLFYGTSTTSNASGSQDSTWECFIDNISINGSFDSLTTSECNWILCGSEPSQFQDGPHVLTVKANVSNQQTFLVRSVCSSC